jgi:Baseplate J-like protein
MPIPPPALDTRTFKDLVAEMLGRIPIHNPEWTNFNRADPGVTILEVAAFLLENDIYVANQIPERNRRKFLQLLGLPLQPGTAARGLVSFTNVRAAAQTLTLNEGLEVRAGPVPFRTTRGLDVLPVEGAAYFKRAVDRPDLLSYYQLLHASQTVPPPAVAVSLYQTTPLPADGFSPDDAIDKSLWIALLARPTEKDDLDGVRRELAGRTLSLGVVPRLELDGRTLPPQGTSAGSAPGNLRVLLPKLPAGGLLPDDARTPEYQALDVRAVDDVLTTPGAVEVTLPSTPLELSLWANLGPLESGVGDFPPAIDDTEQAARLLTWLRVRSPVDLLWVGLNCAAVTQRSHVSAEALPDGTGEPDQTVTLSRAPVLPGTLALTLTKDQPDAPAEQWEEIDELLAAGPEVVAPDPRLPPGTTSKVSGPSKVFALDAESGTVRFGDGQRGARPAAGARLRADYDFGVGRSGNVGGGAISTSPGLPAGFTVQNPIPTWGGADAEAVDEGEKQIPRYLQHRDRLVSAEDFEVLAFRTPGVDLARVEVLPAFHPDLSPSLPGDAAGVVTLLLLPKYDPVNPAAPQPDRAFLDAVACWLEPRRLVTTEVVLRGPAYVPVQVAIALEVVAGVAAATALEAVKQAVRAFLSPLPAAGSSPLDDRAALLSTPVAGAAARGWPLGKPVVALELQAVISRVQGVQLVYPVALYRVTPATSSGGRAKLEKLDSVPIDGLQLPQLLAIDVAVGDTPPEFADAGSVAPAGTVPVPIIPEEC